MDAILAANAHLGGGINSVQVNRLMPLGFTVYTQVEAVVTGDQVGGGGLGSVVGQHHGLGIAQLRSL